MFQNLDHSHNPQSQTVMADPLDPAETNKAYSTSAANAHELELEKMARHFSRPPAHDIGQPGSLSFSDVHQDATVGTAARAAARDAHHEDVTMKQRQEK